MRAEAHQPPALRYSTENCTVGRAMAVLGERWAFVVLREVFNGVRRFDHMRAHTAIPRQVLTDRLALLVDAGILRRVPYREPGERERHEYRLTEKGFNLYPVLVAVWQWGDRYMSDPQGSPVEMAHRDCGGLVTASLSCSEGHAGLAPREVVTRAGPGAIPSGAGLA